MLCCCVNVVAPKILSPSALRELAAFGDEVLEERFLGVAGHTRKGRPPWPFFGEMITLCISIRARAQSVSDEKRTNPNPRDAPVRGSVIIVADLVDMKGAGAIFGGVE